MPVLDPSGFQMAVRIVTTDHSVYPLWMASDSNETTSTLSTVDAALGLETSVLAGLPCVESVDIEIGLGANSKLTISMATPFDIGLDILSSPIMRIGNVIECQVGYPRIGRFLPWISAIAARPDIRISADEGFSATLNGEGGGFIALRSTRTTEYQNVSYVSAIRTLLSNDGYENVDLVVPDSTGESDPLYVTRERLSQSAQSDWFFVQYLTRAANCDAWMEPSTLREGRQTLRVVRREDSLGNTPRFTFLMRGNADFDVYFPIFEFETQAEGVWLPGAATSVRVGELNPANGSVTDLVFLRSQPSISRQEAPLSAESEALIQQSTVSTVVQVPSTGPSVVAPGGSTVNDTSTRAAVTPQGDTSGDHVYVSERDPRTAAQVATAHLTESALRGGGIRATLTTIGIPDLFPGQMVGVAGMGVFDGLYLVTKVSHRLSESDWTMSLDLINNATETSMLSRVISGFTPRQNSSTSPEPAGDAVGSGSITVDPVRE